MLIPLASAGAAPGLPAVPQVSDFGLNDDKTITRTVEGVVNPLVSAKLTIKSNLSDLDAAAVVSKSITTSATSAGQITDDGTGDHVAAIQFELAPSETALLTSAKYGTISVTDAGGNVYILERSIMSAGVPIANPNGRKRTGNWNLNVASIEPPTGGTRVLFQELIDDLDQGEVYTFSRKIQGTVPVGWSIVNLVFTVRRAGTDPDGNAIVTKTVNPGTIAADGTYPVSVTLTAANTALCVGAMVWDAKLALTNGTLTKKYTVAIGTLNAQGPLPAVGVLTPAVQTMAIATPPTVGFAPVQLVLTMADAQSNPIAPSTRVVTWGTSSKAVAIVSQSGLVTAVANGTADIVATCEGVEVRSTVTVAALVFSVTVTPSPIAALAIGSTQALTVVLKDAANNVLTGRTIVYTSSNPSIASVDGSGVVHGVAPGAVTITVTSEGVSTTTAVTVPVPVALVLVTPNPIAVFSTSTQQLTVVTKDAGGNVLTGRTITYASSDPTKATVNSTGLVTGVAAGTTNITATSEGISSSADVATVTVDPFAGYIVFDSLTRADSTSSLGSATEKGGPWTVLQGTPGIASGKGYGVAGDVRVVIGSMPSGNGTIICDLSSANWVTDPVDLMFRAVDKDNYIGFLITSTTSCSLRSRLAGGLALLNNFTFPVALVNGSPVTVKIVVSGTTVHVFQGATEVTGSPATLTGAAAALGGTLPGVWLPTSLTTSTFDNFQVQP